MMEWATSYFETRQVTQPRLSIEWLLADILKCKRLDLYMKYDRPLSPEELETLRPMVKRRSKHEPLQYITGSTEFYNSTFYVDASVLIPRPETEQLIEHIEHDLSDQPPDRILDIGTGSGCIAITLKQLFPQAEVLALDISSEAIDTARKNAAKLGEEITFIHQDIFSFLPEPDQQFDLIVSNPPYIPMQERSTLDTEVEQYEPDTALFLDTPMTIYQHIEQFSKDNLDPDNGHLYLEIHEEFGLETSHLFDANIWNSDTLQDYSSKDRFIKSYLRNKS